MANITKASVLYVLKICAILLVITMCVAFLLSFVNAVTKDKIAANDAAKIAKALGELFPDAATPAATNVDGTYAAEVNGFYLVKDGENTIGYYADVSPVGFKGAVNMMVGLSTDGKVVGVKIISHGETIGIGTKIENEDFLSGFVGKEGALNGSVDTISGATYSSKAVLAGVDAALGAFKIMKGGN